MTGKLHTTKGIVLRTVKYGETSVITAVYTELFGLQSYIINGVRAVSKKGSTKAAFFQPGALLEMVAYHNEFKQLNRLKEYKWAHLYNNIFTGVLKNGVALYMVELLHKCLKQPENNPDLFAFAEDCLLHLDGCTEAVMANFPVFFSVHLTGFLGFTPRSKYNGVLDSPHLVFDFQEGLFTDELPAHGLYLEKKYALILAALLQARHPQELSQIQANAEARRSILEAMETYYAVHLPEFGRLKTLQVLKAIF